MKSHMNVKVVFTMWKTTGIPLNPLKSPFI